MHTVFDIGNSNVVCGLFNQERCLHIWRWETIGSDESRMYYQKRLIHVFLENQIDLSTIELATVSSVVPQMNEDFLLMLEELLKVKVNLIRFDSYPELTIHTDNPDEMGTDLIANAVSALHVTGEDTIVVDFGTALTFTVVEKGFNILGVAIAPGIYTALKSLHMGTAQLPEVSVNLPQSSIGKNTEHAIQAGVFRGYIGLVNEIISSIEKEKGKRFRRIATGGLSGVLTPLDSVFDIVARDLTLQGIRIVGEAMS